MDVKQNVYYSESHATRGPSVCSEAENSAIYKGSLLQPSSAYHNWRSRDDRVHLSLSLLGAVLVVLVLVPLVLVIVVALVVVSVVVVVGFAVVVVDFRVVVVVALDVVAPQRTTKVIHFKICTERNNNNNNNSSALRRRQIFSGLMSIFNTEDCKSSPV